MESVDLKRMGKECIALITKKLSHQISPDEFYAALLDLHEKYPMPGHNPPLNRTAYRNYREIWHQNEFGEWNKGLQPKNFKETAEMYAHHRLKVEEEKEKQPDYRVISVESEGAAV